MEMIDLTSWSVQKSQKKGVGVPTPYKYFQNLEQDWNANLQRLVVVVVVLPAFNGLLVDFTCKSGINVGVRLRVPHFINESRTFFTYQSAKFDVYLRVLNVEQDVTFLEEKLPH